MKNIFKNEKGMTMVSVIVGFAVLMCGSAIFYQAVLSFKKYVRACLQGKLRLRKKLLKTILTLGLALVRLLEAVLKLILMEMEKILNLILKWLKWKTLEIGLGISLTFTILNKWRWEIDKAS